MSNAFKKWLIAYIAPSMRAPDGGISGWLAKRIMNNANPPSIRKGFDRLFANGNNTSTDCFVEIGAGQGIGLEYFAQQQQQDVPRRIVCVEISPDFRTMLQELKNNNHPYADRIEIHEDDCKAMPYLEDASVDKIFAMNVIYFLDPLDAYLAEMQRVLKPGGVVSFCCKFATVKDAGGAFVNIVEADILECIEKRNAFDVTSTFVDMGGETGNPMHSFTEILATKR